MGSDSSSDSHSDAYSKLPGYPFVAKCPACDNNDNITWCHACDVKKLMMKEIFIVKNVV